MPYLACTEQNSPFFDPETPCDGYFFAPFLGALLGMLRKGKGEPSRAPDARGVGGPWTIDDGERERGAAVVAVSCGSLLQ